MAATPGIPRDSESPEGSSLSNNPAAQRTAEAARFKFECAACGKVADDASSGSEGAAVHRIEAKGWRGRGDPTSPYRMLWFCPDCPAPV